MKLIWETDDISNLSPAILSASNLVYLSSSLTSWEHLVEANFANHTNDTNYSLLKEELLTKLALVRAEFNLKPNYVDVLPVTFESKIRLVLSILKVS